LCCGVHPANYDPAGSHHHRLDKAAPVCYPVSNAVQIDYHTAAANDSDRHDDQPSHHQSSIYGISNLAAIVGNAGPPNPQTSPPP